MLRDGPAGLLSMRVRREARRFTQASPMADNDDIPFNRNFPLKPGVVDDVRPGVRRVLCNNPSPFTFTRTVGYIVGRGKGAIIDPRPPNEAHAPALLDPPPRQ